MSQEKVTKYKEQKANRKELMKKAKQQKMIRNTSTTVALVATFAWVGYSAVDYVITNQPRQEVEYDFSAIDEYIDAVENAAAAE